MKTKNIFLGVLFAVVAVVSRAITISQTNVNVQVTFSSDASGVTFDGSATDSDADGTNHTNPSGQVNIYKTTADGADGVDLVFYMLYAGIGPTKSATASATAGQWYVAYKYATVYTEPGNAFSGVTTVTKQWFQDAPEATHYYVNIPIPAGAAYYFAKQNNNIVGQTSQSATGAPYTWRLGPLDTNDPVSIFRVTGGYVIDNGDGHQPGITSDTQSVQAGGNLIPLPGASGGGGGANAPALPNPTQPLLVNPTPAGPHVPDVPPSPSKPLPNPNPPPNPTPSGSGGTTKADTEKQTNDLVDVLNKGQSNATSDANGIIAAVNAETAASVTGSNGIIDAVNATTRAVDKVGANTEVANGFLKKISDKNDADAVALKDAVTSVNDQGAALGAAVAGKITAAQSSASATADLVKLTPLASGAGSIAGVVPIPGDNGYALQTHAVSTTGSPIVAGAAGGGQMDSNVMTSDVLASVVGSGTVLAFCTWVKNLISWCTVVGFLAWTFGQVKENAIAMTSTPQMSLPGSTQIIKHTAVFGNSIGVPAAGLLYGIQIVALSTLILSAPVIIVAAFADAGGGVALAATGATAGTAAGGVTNNFLLNAFSYMYVILPVTVLITAFVNGLLVRVAGVTQWVISCVMYKILSV